MHPLDGARFKIVRAQEHLDVFKSERRTFIDTKPYRFESEVYGEHWWVKPRVTQVPPLRLSAIVGDCVTNSRAALDYIAWELCCKFLQPPIDLTKWEDRTITAFPISANSASDKRYADRMHRLSNRKMPTDAITEINTAQPDVSANDALVWLHTLVNHDKHRMPILTIGSFTNAQIEIHQYKGLKRLIRSPIIKDGVTIKAEPGLLSGIESGEVQVNVEAAVDITCSDFSMPREPLDITLEQIIKTIADLIPRFDRFF